MEKTQQALERYPDRYTDLDKYICGTPSYKKITIKIAWLGKILQGCEKSETQYIKEIGELLWD